MSRGRQRNWPLKLAGKRTSILIPEPIPVDDFEIDQEKMMRWVDTDLRKRVACRRLLLFGVLNLSRKLQPDGKRQLIIAPSRQCFDKRF